VIQTPTGPQTYRIAAVANDALTLKLSAMFISQATSKTDFQKSEDILLMVNLKPGADKNKALADIRQILIDYPQFVAIWRGSTSKPLRTTNSGDRAVLRQ